MIGIEAGAPGPRAPPCIHLLGCPEDQPEHFFGPRRQRAATCSAGSSTAPGSRSGSGFVTVGFAIVIGTLIGAIAGFVGGRTDNVLMRLMDVLLAFPSLLLAIAIVTVLGPGLINAQLAIGIVAIPIYARVMRASVLSDPRAGLRDRLARAGRVQPGILRRRILPNALTPLIVPGTLGIAAAVLEVAALSFLGLGAQPPLAEWGSMIGARAQPGLHAPAPASSSRASRSTLTSRLQPARRRPPRRPRPEAEPMTDDRPRDGAIIEERAGRDPPPRPASACSTCRACGPRSTPATASSGRSTGIDFHVDRGEVLGLVGESGCGKSVTSLSILRPRRQAGPDRGRRGPVRRPGPAHPRRRRDAQDPRRPDRDDLPAADLVAQPGLGRRPPDRRGARDPPRA